MRIELIKATTLQELLKIGDWPQVWLRSERGFLAFDSMETYVLWKETPFEIDLPYNAEK